MSKSMVFLLGIHCSYSVHNLCTTMCAISGLTHMSMKYFTTMRTSRLFIRTLSRVCTKVVQVVLWHIHLLFYVVHIMHRVYVDKYYGLINSYQY